MYLPRIRAGDLSDAIAVEIRDQRPAERYGRFPPYFPLSVGIRAYTVPAGEELPFAVVVHVGHQNRAVRRLGQAEFPFDLAGPEVAAGEGRAVQERVSGSAPCLSVASRTGATSSSTV